MASALEDRIVNVLYSPAVRAINFTLDFLTYDAEGFARVARAIRAGTIEVVEGQSAVRSGNYAFERNRFSMMSTLPAALLEATIVHEAAHALQDARGMPMTSVSMEVGAYIANAVFWTKRQQFGRVAAAAARGSAKNGTERTVGTQDVGNAIVDVLRQNPELLADGHTYLSHAAIEPLERALAAHPHYRPTAYEYFMLDGTG